MKHAIIQTNSVPTPRRRSAVGWVDFLLIAATALTFAAVVAVTHSHARARSQAGLGPMGVSGQLSHVPTDPGLARVRTASAGTTRG